MARIDLHRLEELLASLEMSEAELLSLSDDPELLSRILRDQRRINAVQAQIDTLEAELGAKPGWPRLRIEGMEAEPLFVTTPADIDRLVEQGLIATFASATYRQQLAEQVRKWSSAHAASRIDLLRRREVLLAKRLEGRIEAFVARPSRTLTQLFVRLLVFALTLEPGITADAVAGIVRDLKTLLPRP